MWMLTDHMIFIKPLLCSSLHFDFVKKEIASIAPLSPLLSWGSHGIYGLGYRQPNAWHVSDVQYALLSLSVKLPRPGNQQPQLNATQLDFLVLHVVSRLGIFICFSLRLTREFFFSKLSISGSQTFKESPEEKWRDVASRVCHFSLNR